METRLRAGRRRKRRRKGPPGTSSRGGCLRSSSRWPRADVICSKSSRPRPGSWREEVCGQWSGQGRESRAWGTLSPPPPAAALQPRRGLTLPTYTPHTPTTGCIHSPGLCRNTGWVSIFAVEIFTLYEVHKSGLYLVSVCDETRFSGAEIASTGGVQQEVPRPGRWNLSFL